MYDIKEKFITSISSIIGIVVSLSFSVSIIYDWGFYSSLGLTFDTVAASLSDHFRSTLIWLPTLICSSLAVVANELLTQRIEQGLTEKEIIENSP